MVQFDSGLVWPILCPPAAAGRWERQVEKREKLVVFASLGYRECDSRDCDSARLRVTIIFVSHGQWVKQAASESTHLLKLTQRVPQGKMSFTITWTHHDVDWCISSSLMSPSLLGRDTGSGCTVVAQNPRTWRWIFHFTRWPGIFHGPLERRGMRGGGLGVEQSESRASDCEVTAAAEFALQH